MKQLFRVVWNLIKAAAVIATLASFAEGDGAHDELSRDQLGAMTCAQHEHQ